MKKNKCYNSLFKDTYIVNHFIQLCMSLLLFFVTFGRLFPLLLLCVASVCLVGPLRHLVLLLRQPLEQKPIHEYVHKYSVKVSGSDTFHPFRNLSHTDQQFFNAAQGSPTFFYIIEIIKEKITEMINVSLHKTTYKLLFVAYSWQP